LPQGLIVCHTPGFVAVVDKFASLRHPCCTVLQKSTCIGAQLLPVYEQFNIDRHVNGKDIEPMLSYDPDIQEEIKNNMD